MSFARELRTSWAYQSITRPPFASSMDGSRSVRQGSLPNVRHASSIPATIVGVQMDRGPRVFRSPSTTGHGEKVAAHPSDHGVVRHSNPHGRTQVEVHQRRRLAVAADQHVPAATDAAHPGFEHGECECSRQRRVNGIAAGPQDFRADFGGTMVLGDDGAAGTTGRQLLSRSGGFAETVLRSVHSRWQAAVAPSARSTSRGRCAAHLSNARGQRGWNAHPAGGLRGLG